MEGSGSAALREGLCSAVFGAASHPGYLLLAKRKKNQYVSQIVSKWIQDTGFLFVCL
jgi:hypothetical protein